jgi:predicted ATPase/DNA-binding winged helix-turn-helix (wHTH) protein
MTRSHPPTSDSAHEYRFESFHFIPSRQLLLYRDTPLHLGGRALAILAQLVEHPGEVISKSELIARAWPKSVVDEGNLKVHIAALRRALGKVGRERNYVATVSGHGYRFVAPVVCNMTAILKPPPVSRTTTGRGEAIAALLHILARRRFVSIVGAGGVGKSAVALPVAEAFVIQSGMELCFVEFSSLVDARCVAGTVAAALGAASTDAKSDGDFVPALLATLRTRRVLLVLDNCEHVIDSVAALADHLTHGAPELRILATSREPLRAADEYLYRLAPLPFPVPEVPTNATEMMAFPAVELFVSCAARCLDGYDLSDADAHAVAEICRRLEGIPLAIELAATRMNALGAAELAARLGDRFELLQRGRRGAQERHRTLSASLDWSYNLLPESERALLRSLSVFAGSFTLAAAAGLYRDAVVSTIVDGVANLVDKSLLSVRNGQRGIQYQMLSTTRVYAQDKLALCGELHAARERHLKLHRVLCARAADEWGTLADSEWRARYAYLLDDVRSALAWAFSPEGCDELGFALTAAAIPMWMHLSLLDECHQWVERALHCNADSNLTDACDEMMLRTALGATSLCGSGLLPWLKVLGKESFVGIKQNGCDHK